LLAADGQIRRLPDGSGDPTGAEQLLALTAKELAFAR
jgi:hypothetical protein